MTRLIIIGAALAWISAAALAQDRITEGEFARPAPDLENGRAVAVGVLEAATGNADPRAACFRCHGIDGSGDRAAAFPRLTGQVAGYLQRALTEYASGIRDNPIMTPIAQALTDQEMLDVLAYYASLEDAPFPERIELDLELLRYGAALAAVGSAMSGYPACRNCHGPEGAGLPPNYPYLAGQYAAYMEARLRAWRDGTQGDGLSGVMAGIAHRMSDRDIAAVSAYYATIRPPGDTTDLVRSGVDPSLKAPLGAVR
jgi:cytochrome c553